MKKYRRVFLFLLSTLFSVPCGAENSTGAAETEIDLTENVTVAEAESVKTEAVENEKVETEGIDTGEIGSEEVETESSPDIGKSTDTDAEVQTEETWDLNTWWNEKVMPLVIAYAIPALLFLAETLPMLCKVKKASGRFDSSADSVNNILDTMLKRDETLTAEKNEFRELVQKQLDGAEERAKQYEEKFLAQQNELKAAMEQVTEIANGYRQELAASEERLSAELQRIEKCSDKTEKMVYLGFTNSCEMVTNGAAKKIAKVEESNDEG